MAHHMIKSDPEILETSETIQSFIDAKIKARNSMGNEVPFYVANLDSVYEKFLKWQDFLPRVKPFYAVKCNNTPAVLRMLSALGTGFDCASKSEMEMVMSLGVEPSRIIYAHTIKPQSHIRYACAQGVNIMTFDCEEELLKIATCHPKAKLVLRIFVDDSKSVIKLNSKFGAHLPTAGGLLKRAQELHLNVIGVSFHVGSLCMDREAYTKAIADARQVFDHARTLGLAMSLLDIGGGLNGMSDSQTSIQQMSIEINEALDEFFPADCGVRIIAEPGRYFVDTGFTLAVNINGKRVVQCEPIQDKEDSGKCLDKTVFYYLSDGLYGSMSFKICHSDFLTFYPHLPRSEGSERRYKSIFWGPTCDSWDRITDTVWMPELNVGEWVLVDDFGAYTLVVACDFNGFEKAQVYPVVTAQTWSILCQYFNK